eukprot:CAMPEP_0201695808 /NCGR_PEP_ID=MMETSP0578-20130828/7656_1 /ASSEMBLY_ACC=CAM_ASM_000663 /TAXON_ID=267565 /ORGANISM="Skeletonema grethea, Strain CCMP 1804" /LENGTH=171 /DNA_ID=CAMNT_0048181713 /DNA_START=125 /DNA_END=638 /DNA_ORIENTATION=-
MHASTQQHHSNRETIFSQHKKHSAAYILSTSREAQGASSNGTPEITFGGIILAVVGIDYYLQQRNDQQRNEMIRRFEEEVKQDEEVSRKEERELINNNGGAGMKSLFQCIVRVVPQQFDGHKCLTNLKVGDVVNVLQEGVGPDNKYNLCSIERSAASSSSEEKHISVGWFP